MSYKNEPITEKDFKESISNIDEAISDISKITEISRKGQSNPKFPYQLNDSKLEQIIKELQEDKKILLKQYTCTHKNTTGLVYIGHDSHKDHYEDKCLDCGFIFETDQY